MSTNKKRRSSWGVNKEQLKASLWTLTGQGIPLLIALGTIPRLLRGLGNERFSALTLAWALIGYLLLFDLGFSRAITQKAAVLLSQHRRPQVRRYFWSANWALASVGIFILFGLGPLLPEFVSRLHISNPNLHNELILSGEVLLWSVPVLLLTAQFRGLLEAYQKFAFLGVIQLFTGSLASLTPLLFIHTASPLLWGISSIVCLRILSLAIHAWVLVLTDAEVARPTRLYREELAELWKFSSWITFSNVIGPLLVSFDRFALSLLVPLAHVASYTTPMEMVTKIWIIPASITRVLFPSFSGNSNISSLHQSYLKSLKWTLLTLLPILLIGALMAHPFLSWWLGSEFAQQAAPCFQILLVGVCFNSMAWLPFTLLHSRGLSRPVALLHLIELPFYFASFWLFTQRFGISGAAAAWSLRCFADALGLFLITTRFFQDQKRSVKT
ncbi:MAG: flippase [Bdellovibrio sp.]